MALRITPGRLSLRSSLIELFAYRDLLLILASREISVRYKQTALGFLWVVVQPLMATALFGLIFGRFAHLPSDGIPYPLFAFCGMTIWGLFSHAVERASQSIIADERLITKVYFPRATIPLASILSSGFDFLVTFVILLAGAACYRFFPGPALVAALGGIAIAAVAAAGLGTLLAGLTVRYRDFRYLVPFFLQLGLYASPIVYSSSVVPEAYRFWYHLNPMVGAIDLFRYGIAGHPAPDPAGIALSAAVSVFLLGIGANVFQRVEQSFADHI